MQNLHGCTHRVCDTGVRPHDDLYRVRQGAERVSHLPPVYSAGGAILPSLNAGLPHSHTHTETPRPENRLRVFG